ncbi:hypothetical protein HMPREF9278_0986 [Mobiluncus mulieris FB024-16]|nr:hypothetical protein HMPREF9278_0986 [Mobiluncus mulieris FB024-16]
MGSPGACNPWCQAGWGGWVALGVLGRFGGFGSSWGGVSWGQQAY